MFRKIVSYFLTLTTFLGTSFFVAQFLFIDNPMMNSSDRAPSSIQKVYDYSDLAGTALQMAARDRLVNSIDIAPKNGEFYLEMGNFVLFNSDNKEKDFACGYYNKLTYEFEAEDVFVEGDKPKLLVEAGCEVAANINFMTPLKIPVTELKSQKPSQSEFKFFDSGRPITISMTHGPTEWPTKWVLKNVKMTHSQFSARILQVPTFEEGMGHRQQITMKW